MAALVDSMLSPTGREPEPRNNSSSLRRALRVLSGVAAYRGSSIGITLTALAASLGMSKSTVLRLIGPLRDEGLVHQDRDSGRYRLGPAVARLGATFAARVDLEVLAVDLLRDLSKQTGEPASVVVPGLQGRSAGAVVLAVADPDAVEGQGSRIAESVRDRGWWMEVESVAKGGGTVAAPVVDHRSRVVAAVESRLPAGSFRSAGSAALPMANTVNVGAAVRDCATRLSDRLGAPLIGFDLAGPDAS